MTGTIAAIVLWAVVGLNQGLVPGTALPVYLDTNLNAKKLKPGQPISATLTQDVPLSDRGKIRSGSHVTGHVLDVGRNPDGTSFIRIRFDVLHAKHWGDIPIMTSLRAVATPWEVQDAQLPKVGPMINPNPASWTTYQIGGDIVLRGGGHVMHGHTVIGDPVPDGVLGKLLPVPQAGCTTETGDRRVALWVFGSAACGSYGFFDRLDIGHAGDKDPLGDIVLESDKNVHVPTGSGLLLITIDKPGAESRPATLSVARAD